MAFLIDRGIAAESEEEFDAEGDRYEELKNKLLGGQNMKYEETEELLAAAEARNDQKVIGVLKNVAGDPEAGDDTVDESTDDPTGAPLDRLDAAIGRLKGADELTADDAWIEDSKEIVLSYENVGWYENLDTWAEDPSDDVESDLDKIYGALLESGYGLRYSRKAVEKAVADAAVEAASDPERITPKENRFGDWDSVATCNVHVPFEIVDGPANVLPEEEEFQEKEELLPDCVVNEAVETLRRMY